MDQQDLAFPRITVFAVTVEQKLAAIAGEREGAGERAGILKDGQEQVI